MKKLKMQELIFTGVYTAIYFLLVSIVMVVLKVAVPVFDSLLLPAASALFSGIIYLLMLQKVPRFGGISVMGGVFGLLFLVTGHFPMSFVPSFVCAILADFLQYNWKINEKIRTTVTYIIFSFGLTGPLLPMWFMKNAYVDSLIRRGKDADYINYVFEPITQIGFIICVVSVIVCSIAGIYIGRKLLAKHFQTKR
ncbi:MptD family putative ECF transporter S component [Candidatus Enterococcus willemsii]|uniref:ABC transporter permease n=1 Tax=Candidatus Enterococcus willemsii TaxID=1857215 RepID=A0ABQ6Z1D3_9ENTE|nr:MptD family putative ECF transporter S component [Enterococcus sp. CU12B]KAF1305102.1 ABC transporter permease [Enterococcus sp. CU12B]